MFLALVKSNVQKLLVRAGFYDKFDKNNVFLTLHGAVLGALRLHPMLLSQIILDAPLYPITRTNMSVSNSTLEGIFHITKHFLYTLLRFHTKNDFAVKRIFISVSH